MNSKWKTTFVWLIGIAVVALIVFIGMKDSIVRPMNEEKANAMKTEPIDVEAYYREKSEIVASYDVKTSESIQSEEQAIGDLTDRGFTQCPVSYDY